MCGIFGYVGKRSDASDIVFNGLKSLEYRGYDSWGVAVVADKKIYIKKKAGKIGNSNVNNLPKSSLAIGHTRWATHGGVTDINAHPHMDCSGSIAIIHNGIFENYEQFKNDLIKKGHKFVSQTDTETIAHMLEGTLGKKTPVESLRAVFNKMDGLNAIISINSESEEIVAARNGSPLVIGFGKNENFLASDASALIPYTRDVYFLEDDEIAEISGKNVKVFDSKSGKIKMIKKQKINWKVSREEKGRFPDFMLKEIFEQPRTISEIAQNGLPQAKKMSDLIKKSKDTFLVGCGTASYACLAGSYMFSKIAKYHINAFIGSEFGYELDFLNSKSLVIGVSQSGETMDILESVKKAKEKNAQIASLVNVLGSALYRRSDYKTVIGAGTERAVASTKAFTGMLAYLLLFSYELSGRGKEGQKTLFDAVDSVNKILVKDSVKHIKDLAIKIKNKGNVYVIGRGISYPASLETALKIKEISYIHAEGLAAGELKHGPLALVEKGTPCIAFLPNDETYGANLAGAMEMKARGGFVIGVSFKNHEVFDYFIPIKDCGEATIIPNVIFGQLLGYYLAKSRKLDPDKPRNLAKSVTVK